MTKKNVGVEAAQAVCEKHENVSMVVPKFKGSEGTDFNDLANQEGIDEVRRQIQSQDVTSTFQSRITTFDSEYIKQIPKPKPMILGRYPIGCTSALVAMGGVGKTTYAMKQAVELATLGKGTLFLSSEDDEKDYQSKTHNLLYTKFIKDNPYSGIDVENIAGKIHVLNERGTGKKLIEENNKHFVPSVYCYQLAEYLNQSIPNIGLIFTETVNRFAGGEENERMEAIVSGCDYIAMTCDCAVVLIHHTGKAQARGNITDLYSGRGGSALGDNTRSMTVLTRISTGENGYAGEQPPLADIEDITAGRVFEVKHVRNSFGSILPPEYYLARAGDFYGPVLEPLKIATKEDITQKKVDARNAQQTSAALLIRDIIKKEGGKVPRKYFESGTQKLIGIGQQAGRELIKDMIEEGSLGEEEQKSENSKQTKKFLVTKYNYKGVS